LILCRVIWQYGNSVEISEIITQLKANRATFETLLSDIPTPLQLWRPHAEHWCLLEIICHLYDEEREDFRARLTSVLDDPTQPLPVTDPQMWLTSRHYLEQDFATKLSAFLTEREASVKWLNELSNPNWANAYHHPRVGPLTARMFLVNWLAHDYLHIRQITRVKYQYLQATLGESLEYAGTW
jgi:hypothetical protein